MADAESAMEEVFDEENQNGISLKSGNNHAIRKSMWKTMMTEIRLLILSRTLN